MHLPDGTISNQASLTFLALSGSFAFWAAKQIKGQLLDKVRSVVPQLATDVGSLAAPRLSTGLKIKPAAKRMMLNSLVVCSLIYAVQLFDFPLINGVSGHLIGAALAGMVLGPALGLLTMSVVLIVQALSGDGGIMALGANIFTMAVVGSLGGHYLFILFKKYLPVYAAIFLATLLSVIFSALCFGLILLITHQISISRLFSSVFLPHTIVGLLEAFITVITIKFVFPTSYQLQATS